METTGTWRDWYNGAAEWLVGVGQWLWQLGGSAVESVSAFFRDPRGTVVATRDLVTSTARDGASYLATLSAHHALTPTMDMGATLNSAGGKSTRGEDLLFCAKGCLAAYQPLESDHYKQWHADMLKAGFTVDEVRCREGRARAVVITKDKDVTVVMRGTKGIKDFIADACCTLLPCEGGGRIHGGFGQETQRCLGDIIGQIPANAEHVRFTGHSMGGALAVLAAQKLHQRPEDRKRRGYESTPAPAICVATFGAPSTGDETFASAYNKRGIETFHVVHDTDPVPHLCPPQLGFAPTGSRIVLGDKGASAVPMGKEGAHNPMLSVVNMALTGKETTHRLKHYIHCLEDMQAVVDKAKLESKKPAPTGTTPAPPPRPAVGTSLGF